jgi:WS/DGAT/MGAT family acyltransferase
VAGAVRAVLADPGRAWESATGTARGIAEAVAGGLSPAPPSALNVDIGPHRRFDWTAMDLEPIRARRGTGSATVNDVVLAMLTGALRRFLYRRGDSVEGVDFRVMIPVNVRTVAEQREVGNRVAMLVVRLPLDEADPRDRLARVVEETQRMKRSNQALGVRTLEEFSNQVFTSLFTEFGRLASYAQPFNLVVTNVPGPQFPVYIEGAKMLSCYPLVPLFRNQALGIALFSYDGRMYWGFNGDWDALPDLHDLVAAVDAEAAAMIGV